MSGMLGTPSFDLDAEAFEELVEDILDEDPAPRRFYSREEHLVRHPGPADGEDVILDRLFDDDVATGLVVTGSGGVGKSRPGRQCRASGRCVAW